MDRVLGRVRILTALGAIAGIALSLPLWTTRRDFPLAPVLGGRFYILPPIVDYLPVLLLLSGWLACAFSKRWERYAFWVFAGSLSLVALDQSRLQPWVYQYLLFLLIVWSARVGSSRQVGVRALRLLVASIYVWSGVQKLNPHFHSDILVWLVEPLARWFPGFQPDTLPGWASVASAVFEIALGPGLLLHRTRKLAALGAISMHLFLLAMLGPWGHNWNSVVWPWNLAMIGFVQVLFLGARGSFCWPSFAARAGWFPKWVAVSAALLPALNFVGLWDSYLSFSLYSARTASAWIAPGIPTADRALASTSETDLLAWSYREMNVPVYPERRVFVAVFRERCRIAGDGQTLRISGAADPFTGQRAREILLCRQGIVVSE